MRYTKEESIEALKTDCEHLKSVLLGHYALPTLEGNEQRNRITELHRARGRWKEWLVVTYPHLNTSENRAKINSIVLGFQQSLLKELSK